MKENNNILQEIVALMVNYLKLKECLTGRTISNSIKELKDCITSAVMEYAWGKGLKEGMRIYIAQTGSSIVKGTREWMKKMKKEKGKHK